MTQGVVIRRVGGPDVLSWEPISVGEPGPGEVRVAQRAVGLNFIDIYHRTGYYPQTMPFTPGVEAAGQVDAIGDGVSQFSVGDRVAYVGPIGAYSEQRIIATDRLIRLPDAISYEQAAASLLRGMTAQVLLRQVYSVKAGDWILVHAAAGGTGLILCQWASALGANVIGTVSSERKAAIAKENGCKHPILYSSQDFVDEVGRITGGEKTAAVFDSVGRDTFLRSLDCLRPRGTMVTFGQSSGPIEPIAPILLLEKGSLVLTRPTVFHFIEKRSELEACAADFFDVVASGKVRVNIGGRFPLRDAAKAQTELEARATTGSIVLTV